MLFKAQAFKSPSIDSQERLYSLNVLNGLNEQKLPLREELDDEFIFCQTIREADGVRIARELQAITDWVRYWMNQGGKITGMDQVTKPYCLRDGAAKALNESCTYRSPQLTDFILTGIPPITHVSESLQCLILQHASIDIFLKHYLDRRITADVAKIYRGMEPEKELMKFACSMSRSIDPRRPWKLTAEQSASVNDLPCVIKWIKRVKKLSGGRKGGRRKDTHKEDYKRTLTGRVKKSSGASKGSPKGEQYAIAVKRLKSEKQRQMRLILIDIRDRYKKEQPVIDSERQLSGKAVDEEVRSLLEQLENMTLEHLLLIDTIMTLPETTPEEELRRKIAAINAVTAYCGVEEGRPYFAAGRSRPAGSVASASVNAKGQVRSALNIALSRAVASVRTNKRPKICFLCLGNLQLSMDERVSKQPLGL
jgi:hypothetical protein